MTVPGRHKTALEILKERKPIDDWNLSCAEERVPRERKPIQTIVLEMELMTREALLGLLRDEWKVEIADLSAAKVDAAVVQLIPEALARKQWVLPIAREGSVLVLAMADPCDLFVSEDIRLRTGLEVRPLLALPQDILACLDAVYPPGPQYEIKYGLPDAPRRHLLILRDGGLEFCASQDAAAARVNELGPDNIREVWEMKQRTVVRRSRA